MVVVIPNIGFAGTLDAKFNHTQQRTKKYLSMRERQRLSVSNTVEKLDMNAKIARRMVFFAEAKCIKATVEKLDKKRKEPQDKVVEAAGKASYQTMVSDSDYTEFDNFSKLLTCLLSTISMERLNSRSCVFVQIAHGSYGNEPVVINGKKITVTDIFPLLVSATLKHQNLVRIIAVCRKPMVWSIVTEYAKGGSVRQFFATRQSQVVPLKLALTQALDVARGMEYLQSLGFVHRDPMPRQPADNVFYRSANVLDSASLRSERKFYTERLNNSYVVVLWENVDNKQTMVSNAYVYGFGVIVLEVV
ncbi:serine/threonine-protein kinase STY13-like [Cryptomeria japonica]|uniref:serine/threonine-protein kinase STY13-like n=1 Tax=Cryptomeria japonica TaxID=3369 RepID=UPI0027DA77B4|nr:serine/threonine-protein kinase STY13-like [Cryptomeria japonica]